ncbi:MAG: IS1595 family transposase [Pseudomonadota bacterium]|nr:IS1595 family transposase [Pseudomonadota bacterium]
MAMNRVQFQPGLSMHQFMALYGTRDKCEAAVIGWRWPHGYVCPSCGQADGSFSSFRRGQLLYRQCSGCHVQCSVIAGSIFEATKLPLTVWFLAMHLLTQAKTNMSMLELSRHLGVSYPSAWLMKHKLMEVMRLREDSRQLSGRVELDDGYLGGQRSGGKTGRGSENKTPFVTAVQTTESGEAKLVCLAQVPFTKEAMTVFVDKRLVRPLTVVSDGLACFTVTAKAGVHDRIVVSAGDPSAAYARFKAVSTIQSNLKTAISGAYHSIKLAKYAHRYLAEFQYRFNRRFDMRAIFARLARVACSSPPQNRLLIRVAEIGC